MRILPALLILVITSLPVAADTWPHWVEDTPLPAAPERPQDFTRSGVQYLLSDRQVRLEPQGHDRFTRRVVRITNRSGLENEGAIRINFDPEDEELIVHDIWRTRAGVRSRVTGLDFIDIRRESGIDYGILDGRLTRYADIPDLRVGDVLDISWTARVTPSVFAEHFLYWWTDAPTSGFQHDQFRLTARADREVVVTGPADPVITRANGWTNYRWSHINMPEVEPDDDVTDWNAFYGYTQITTASTWSDVVDRVRDAYAPQPLPPALSKRVRAFEGTTAERVTAAFRLVQEDIRYMGIEIGAGGYLPRAPGLVWSRRFGDCKDKALLLVSMLTEMGIEADTVLVNAREGDDLATYAPSPYLFNHAIVRVLGDGEPYFLDPTDALQGGVGAGVQVSDFVWALPLSDGSDALVAVPRPEVTEPTYEVLSRYEFKDSGDLAAELFVATTYRGEDADWQRSRYSRSGTEDRADQLYEWYEDRYPGATVLTALHLEDDLDANEFTVHAHYGLTDEGLADHRAEFWMNPYAVAGELDELPDEPLSEPYELDPFFYRHRVELVGFDGLSPPPEIALINEFFRYTRTGYEVEGGIGGAFELELTATEVTPDQAAAYTEAVDEQDSKDDRRYALSGANRLLAQPMMMGVSLRGWVISGSLGFVLLCAALFTGLGYRRERIGL